MNEEIESIFQNFEVPVSFLRYDGHLNTYVVYMETDKDNSFACDDAIAGYVTYYDFDVYSKTNYNALIDIIKSKMRDAGWTWQPSRDSTDMFEKDTGFFHKTLCFAKEVQI